MAGEEQQPPREGNRVDWRSVLRRVIARRCPRCGQGELFQSRMRLAPTCATCGLLYRREDGAMTGQMYLSAVVTEIFAVLIVFAVFFGTDLGPVASIALGLPVVVLFSYWFLPRGMALWVGVEFLTDAVNREPWTGD